VRKSACCEGVVGLLSLLVVLGLDVPWTCGDTYPVTQGHNGGSHTGFNAWAWDFGLPVGTEVWAATPGTVTHIKMDGNSGGCDPSHASHANYVAVDHGDGTNVLYLHLEMNSSPLDVGDEVWTGDLIGRVGLTGWVCGAHLHFVVQESCGSYFCQSVPATFVDYGDPPVGTQLTSANCPPCLVTLDGGETEISELDAGCFQRQTPWWWSSSSGLDGHHFYTIASNAAAPETIGTWRFGVSTPGDYQIEVFIPEEDAEAQGAVYEVHHDGGVEQISIDQAAAKGWQALGVFTFVGGDDERISLADNTGESTDLSRRLAYDNVRLTFVPVEEDTTGGMDDDGSMTTGTTLTTTGTTGVDPSHDTGHDDSGSQGGALPDVDGAPDGGCACAASSPVPFRPEVFALGVLGFAIRRRP
jgi:MYXO-CTERM domain-containing protein